MSAVRAATVEETSRRPADVVSPAGSASWYLRAQNFVVAVTELVAGDPLTERDLPDEHLLLVPGATRVVVSLADGRTAEADEPALFVVPAGTSTVTASGSATVLRVFAGHVEEAMQRALRDAPALPDPAVAPLGTSPRAGAGDPVRVHRLSQVPDEPGRFGRIFCSTSLMVNWFAPQVGPRDTEQLSPHWHDDFEQVSVTLAGSFVHHFRTPWTPRMSEWRDDEHVAVGSPSLALIPAGLVHTTRAVGDGVHTLVDVFAPPRADFLANGWVLDAGDLAGAG